MASTGVVTRPIRSALTWAPWAVGLGFAAWWGVNGLRAGYPFFGGAALFWSSVLIVLRDVIGARTDRVSRIPADAVLVGVAFLFGWEGGIAILPAAIAFLIADAIDAGTPRFPVGGSLHGRGVVVLAGGTLVLVLSVILAGGLYSTATSSALPSLGIDNGTSLTVSLFVNGQHMHDAAPGETSTLGGAPLPPLPWMVEARSAGGRVLTSMHVGAGEVGTPNGNSQGVFGRVDLSCGRLTIWAGDIDPEGPRPAGSPGTPGDCAP